MIISINRGCVSCHCPFFMCPDEIPKTDEKAKRVGRYRNGQKGPKRTTNWSVTNWSQRTNKS